MLENDLHVQCAAYLKYQYPDIYFTFDPSGEYQGGKVKNWKRINDTKAKRSNHAQIDMFISEPSGTYHGLFIELKKETPFKKDGKLKASDHLRDQEKTLVHLAKKGYCCAFIWDLDDFKQLVDDYMNNKI
jgi:hypothetical protein